MFGGGAQTASAGNAFDGAGASTVSDPTGGFANDAGFAGADPFAGGGAEKSYDDGGFGGGGDPFAGGGGDYDAGGFDDNV